MSFWLQVRKEYIIDNLDQLIEYLSRTSPDSGVPNPGYESTVECLDNFAAEIGSMVLSTPSYEPIQLPYGTDAAVRVLGASILAGNKRGSTQWPVISSLALLLARVSTMSGLDTMERMAAIIIGCIRRAPVLATGFTWTDILNPEVNLQLFLYKFKQMRFGKDPGIGSYVHEVKGLILLPPNGDLTLSVVDINKYTQGKYDVLFSLPRMLKVLGPEEHFDATVSFAAIYNTAGRLLRLQDHYKPSPSFKLNAYTLEDTFPVRVTCARGWKVEAETIDPRYHSIAGKVLMQNPPKRGKMTRMKDHVSVGDILTVNLSKDKDFAFEIFDTFEDHYRNLAAKCAGQEFTATFCGRYPQGTEWVLSNGLRVGIDQSKTAEMDEEGLQDFECAIAQNLPITVRTYAEAPDMNSDTFHIYAEPIEVSDDKPFSADDADDALMKSFLDYGKSLVIGKGTMFHLEEVPTNSDSFAPFAYILLLIASCENIGTLAKMKCYIGSAMIFKMCGRTKDLDYVLHLMEFLNREVQFAIGKHVDTLPVPKLLENLEEVSRHTRLVEILGTYRHRDPLSEHNKQCQFGWEEKCARIEALVRASNDLADIIDERELNNIKHSIAKLLRVDDEYKSILSDRTYYGDETVTQEFKSSAVYPPANRRRSPEQIFDPEIQKWALIKAACGFLNSRVGGEILLGVNDSGYACGLEDEIRDLHKHKMLKSADADHYRLYISRIFTQAFKDPEGKLSASEIANTHIDVFPETNDEGKQIVRIKVKPYRKNIVMLAESKDERPDEIADWYYRCNGRTVAGTPGTVEEIMKFK